MDLISKGALERLLTSHPEWCISLFMPAHRVGRETEKDPIRFKNLVDQAEKELLAKGLRTPDIQTILQPAQDLLKDYDFWQHQSDGLALFISPDLFEYFRLPIRFEELLILSNHFYIKPLLPLFTNDGHFYMLALSQNEVKLMEGTQYTVDEVDLEKALPNMAETLKFDQFSKQLQFHTGSGRVTDSGDAGAMFHGHDPSDKEEKRLLQWFHKIDDALPEALTNPDSPVVLAGVEYLFPLFKKSSSHPYILAKGIEGNPEQLRPEELHKKAWPLVEPVFKETQNEAVNRYQELADTERASADLEQVFLAAYQARVDILFTVTNYQVWGGYDVDTNTVHIHTDYEPGDEDLLNLISTYTLKNGGTVYIVDPDQMPAAAPLAAVFRF